MRVRVGFNFKIYKNFKDEIEVGDWACRTVLNVEDVGQGEFKITYDRIKYSKIDKDYIEQVVSRGCLYMYVPDYFLEIFEDLEKV